MHTQPISLACSIVCHHIVSEFKTVRHYRARSTKGMLFQVSAGLVLQEQVTHHFGVKTVRSIAFNIKSPTISRTFATAPICLKSIVTHLRALCVS